MKYATIKKHDIANGPGVRVSLFVSGCNHHCKGCFNAEAWDFNFGNDFTEDTIHNDYSFSLMIDGNFPSLYTKFEKKGRTFR